MMHLMHVINLKALLCRQTGWIIISNNCPEYIVAAFKENDRITSIRLKAKYAPSSDSSASRDRRYER